MKLSPKAALALFVVMVLAALAQATWWIVFMARLVGEKVDMAQQLGADPKYLAKIHSQEVSRQIMVGFEGIFFLVLVLLGAWIIYRSLVRSEELKFHQQNFLLAVTHELKTPLAAIRIHLDTLQSAKIPSERKESAIPSMRIAVSRLERLVENILDAGRFERSGYHLNRQSSNLSELVERRLDLLKETPSSVSVTVNRQLQAGIRYFGDSAALGRAIDAVLENSLKYHDGKQVTLIVALQLLPKAIELTIADDGQGFERSERGRIFDRFYRVGNEMTRSQPGSGLGLYLCREIIRAHGGDITAESSGPMHGSQFTITLKRRPNNENDSAG